MASISRGTGNKMPNNRHITPAQVALFFRNFGIEQGVDYKPLSSDRYVIIITTACRWYGTQFARFVATCFTTYDGDTIVKPDNDTDKYHFDYPDEDDISIMYPFIGSR